MRRRKFLHTLLVGGGLASCRVLPGSAQGGASDAQTRASSGPSTQGGGRGPIIDVHMHAYPADVAFPASLINPATGKSTAVKDGEAHLQACLAEMKRLTS